MSQHTTTGVIINKLPAKQVSEKFKVQEFILKVGNDKYPQEVKFQLVNDNIDLLDFIQVNEQVEVTFELRGREYNGTHYVSLNALKVISKLF
jgi:single-strand DNA-binding protein